jgi:hypothetical protein
VHLVFFALDFVLDAFETNERFLFELLFVAIRLEYFDVRASLKIGFFNSYSLKSDLFRPSIRSSALLSKQGVCP